MCCILSCLGWGIDLIQRCWTFAMSACIMTAVGGTLVTSAMSGVALGYNYSLAEYMQLRETNVSVYLKRGVFDDEVADEMDFRRKEGGLAEGSAGEYSGRRMGQGGTTRVSIFDAQDDGPVPGGSRFDSDEHHRFEGSLIRLTAKPATETTTKAPMGSGEYAIERRKLYDSTGSPFEVKVVTSVHNLKPLDAVKAMQAVINERKNKRKKLLLTPKTEAPYKYPTHPTWPMETPPPERLVPARRMQAGNQETIDMEEEFSDTAERAKWYKTMSTNGDGAIDLTVPRPGPLQPKRKKPTRPTVEEPMATEPMMENFDSDPERQESLKKALETLRIAPETRKEEDSFSDDKTGKGKDYSFGDAEVKEYDEDDLKGLPVRRKRSIRGLSSRERLNYRNNANVPRKTDAVQDENSLFSKFIGILRNVETRKDGKAVDKSEITNQKDSNIFKLTPSRLSRTEFTKSNLFSKMSSATSPIILKILKSTITSR